MSDLPDFDLDGSPTAHAQQLAQGIFCEPFFVALPYSWATSIVEEFELVAVPKAAPWLAGIANVAGVILPIIDLRLYFSPALLPKPLHKQHRLLIGGNLGGHLGGDLGAGDDALPMALLFEGLPKQIRSVRSRLSDVHAVPPELIRVCAGLLTDERGESFFELKPEVLTQTLLQAL